MHTHRCLVCGDERTSKYGNPELVHNECSPSEDLKPIRPGMRLTKLLEYIGINKVPGCGCEAMSVKMDRWGPSGCRDNMDEIVSKMRDQATERQLDFSERGARWMVRLAIKLAEQRREPTAFERFGLDQAKKRIGESLSRVY